MTINAKSDGMTDGKAGRCGRGGQITLDITETSFEYSGSDPGDNIDSSAGISFSILLNCQLLHTLLSFSGLRHPQRVARRIDFLLPEEQDDRLTPLAA
jgi:hypothetical protein